MNRGGIKATGVSIAGNPLKGEAQIMSVVRSAPTFIVDLKESVLL